ncbi:glycoside hydrolase family 72 protein [Zasmidium cellare ATCC 36951]|uniref:1,3-beta-glucanosyltransferase n=1 Tax=Zasmidium cellare ATCC 36951 TaxID=1080233 RepID=A0A6A6CGQ3_ZASCE|nr:glycoside hydrolase family 72 protein [Zasmidium cellare ATCC 36951]KAF2165358.1 glycoside hydrolase family 72 protein [Zasmidium cellare ATCC 36951]
MYARPQTRTLESIDHEEKFLIRGLVYQRSDATRGPHGFQTYENVDPIADAELPRLKHDVELFKELGVNTILVYSIDPSKPRDRAMRLLADAGIYVLVTLSTQRWYINRLDPRNSYNSDTMAGLFQIIDAMSTFPNTLGVFAAYDLINNPESLQCAPIVAAVVRDVKRYMAIKHRTVGRRILPIGCGGNINANAIDNTVMRYLSSQDLESRIDFWACKCFPTSQDSGVDKITFRDLIEQYRETTIPVFISEYSIAANAQTQTAEQFEALFSRDMLDVFSGGCVYEMWYDSNSYGLAQMVTPGSVPVDGKKIKEQRQTPFGTLLVYEDFENYRSVLEGIRDGRRVDSSGIVGGKGEETVEEGVQGQVQQALHIPGDTPGSCVDWLAI